jgi:tRNA pseudouridine13 synthase
MYTLKQQPPDFLVKEITNIKPKDTGRYFYYRLTKTNRNTLDVIKELSKQLNVKINQIGFAGTKDKIAITEQLISTPKEIISTKIKIDNTKFQLLGKGDQPITLGELEGNEFTITIRDATTNPQPTNFVENYFDEQRFSKHNKDIGKNIITKQFQNATKLIDNHKVQQYLQTKPNDHIGALKLLPKRLLKLYVHSYQSYLWNETVAKYIKTGNKVPYSLGNFVFSETKHQFTEIPLIGFAYNTIQTDKEIKSIILKQLEEENLTLKDFIIKQIPELSMEGQQRPLYSEIKNLKINKESNSYIIKFSLNKGSYATMVIRKLFKQ